MVSQVMTASPLCRLRLGDLFTSNYSKESMARMMGADDPNFNWEDVEGFDINGNLTSGSDTKKQSPFITGKSYLHLLKNYTDAMNKIVTNSDFKIAKELISQDPMRLFPVTIRTEKIENIGDVQVIDVQSGDLDFAGSFTKKSGNPSSLNDIKGQLVEKEWLENNIIMRGELSSDAQGAASSQFQTIFSSQNPIIKSFESTMGRGIAVAIDSLGFSYKYGEFPWELEAGNRAPRWIDVKLGFKPIHDITPGIDHNGFNRAPVYKVGKTSRSISGDVWNDPKQHAKLLHDVEQGHEHALNGIKTGWNEVNAEDTHKKGHK